MAYIPKINGQSIAAPLPLDQLTTAMDKDSGRAASGTMVRYFIGDKVKLEFEWKYITKQEGRKILGLVQGESCNITYEDTALGVVTKKFYVVDRSSKLAVTDDYFEYVKFSATEF